MSRGAYDPGEYLTPEQQLEHLFPDTDEFGNPWPEDEGTWEPITRLHKFSIVIGGTSGVRSSATSCASAAGAWTPPAPNPPVNPTGPAASQSSNEVSGPVAHDRAA